MCLETIMKGSVRGKVICGIINDYLQGIIGIKV